MIAAVVRRAATARGEFPIDAALEPARGHWSNYPMTVARRLARNFGRSRRGADIAFFSTCRGRRV